MTRFENKLCPVCRTRFNEKADIVVCPECGTPHHRACYSIADKCAVSKLHGTGWSWNGALPDEETEMPPENPDTSGTEETAQPSEQDLPDFLNGAPYIFEERMLEEQFGIDNPFKELFNTFSDNEIGEDGVSMHELMAYSATSVFHYGKAFSSFRGLTDGRKHKAFFNFCSGVFAPIFQFYRRMNVFGILVLLVSILPALAAVIMPEQMTEPSFYSLVYGIRLAQLVITILLCVFGDYIYYRHCVKNIVRFRGSYEGDTKSDEYFMALYEMGRPTMAGGFLGVIALALAWGCFMALVS